MKLSKTNKFSTLTKLILILTFLCIIPLLLALLSFFILHTTNVQYFSLHNKISASTLTSTSLEHIVFGIASSDKSWPTRKDYVKLWWRPNEMKGCVFLESMPGNSTRPNDTFSDLPSVCISGDTSRFRYTFRNGLRSAVRVARIVSEIVALNHTNVRWFVFGDDDTIFFPDNLVKTLSKYDHGLWYYIGTNSESFVQNKFFSHEMAFGGAGFAISYPLAKVLSKIFDSCLDRYPHLYGSDGRIHACLAELGVSLTHEPGFHQLDMRGNIFGLLAAHPIRPLVSLHHMDEMDPIFPNMTTMKSLEHLFQAVQIDPHRIMQQTVCYDRWFSWTISVSWGYVVQVFPTHVLLPDALRVQESYTSWKKNGLHIHHNLDTKEYPVDPCRRPPAFYLDRASSGRDGIKSTYKKMIFENCTYDPASPRKLEEIRVYSHKQQLDIIQAPRRHCCDVLPNAAGSVMEINIRECTNEELVKMHR